MSAGCVVTGRIGGELDSDEVDRRSLYTMPFYGSRKMRDYLRRHSLNVNG
jgi:hypothetical protein